MRRLRVLLQGLRARVRHALFRRSADRQMDEEFRFHLEMETAKNLEAGMSPREARRRARVAFGGVERHREALREGRRVRLVDPLLEDARFGFRSLARTPGASILAAFTISLGVGATTAVFSVVNAILLRPPPIPGVERLATIQEVRSGNVSTGVEGMLIPYERVVEYREATREVFSTLASHRLEEFSLRLPGTTLPVSGALTSGNWFETLEVPFALGRPYTSDHADEVVLSHDFWVGRFGGDPEVLGRTVHLDGRPVTVVGVTARGFRGATILSDDVWAPVGVLGVDPGTWADRSVPIGRLRPGVSFERAAAVVDAAGRSIPPEPNSTVHRVALEPVTGIPAAGRAPLTGFLAMLLGTALMVLLVASANIAGLMLARGVARSREMAVRLAIGAGRGRVVRHLLAESLLIFAAGGAGGVFLAMLGTRWLAAMPLPPQASVTLDLAPDGRVLIFTLLITGLTGVLFGLAPALKASRPDLVPALKAGSGGSVGGDAGRLRHLFVGGQVAAAVLLLLTATLFVRSLQKGLDADLGLDPWGVVVASVDLGPPHDYGAERGRLFWNEVLQRVRVLPGVERAALVQHVPLAWEQSSGGMRRADDPERPGTNASYASVDPTYFEAMGVEIVEGRGFTDADAEGSGRVVVINQTLAERLWPGENPVGQQLDGWTEEPWEVVGVARDGKYFAVTETSTAFVYFPFAQVYRSAMTLLVKAPGAEGATLQAVRDEVRAQDPDVAVRLAAPLEEIIGFGLFPQRFAAQLVGAFGAVGLILAAMGIYGVLSYQVTRRTRELGVRRALGATRADLVRRVVGRGGRLAAIGCVVGVAAGAGLATVLQRFLFGIRPLDPVTFTAVPGVLFAVALLASWLPALRASTVEPSLALREE